MRYTGDSSRYASTCQLLAKTKCWSARAIERVRSRFLWHKAEIRDSRALTKKYVGTTETRKIKKWLSCCPARNKNAKCFHRSNAAINPTTWDTPSIAGQARGWDTTFERRKLKVEGRKHENHWYYQCEICERYHWNKSWTSRRHKHYTIILYVNR